MNGLDRTFRIGIILLVLHLPFAACHQSPDCGDFSNILPYSRVNSMDVSTFSGNQEIMAGDTINFSDLSLQVTNLETELYGLKQNNSFSLIHSGFACSPPEEGEPSPIVQFKINSNLSVFANEERFFPGEDLAELFYVEEFSGIVGKNTSISQFVNSYNDSYIFLTVEDAFINLKLKNDLDSIYTGSFAIEIVFEDKTTFDLETVKMTLK